MTKCYMGQHILQISHKPDSWDPMYYSMRHKFHEVLPKNFSFLVRSEIYRGKNIKKIIRKQFYKYKKGNRRKNWTSLQLLIDWI